MKRISFKFSKAKKNINKILNVSNDYKHLNYLPDINNNKLSYTNGAYVDTTALFIDIRNSSKLTNYYQRRDISRYYRAYINLILMVLRNNTSFKEDNIVGDCVSAIFVGKPIKKYNYDSSDVIDALHSAAMITSLLKMLNLMFFNKYGKKMPIKAGIGIEQGNTLVFKAGLKGYKDHKYIFLGNNVNFASHLCNHANKEGNPQILVNKNVFRKCSDYMANPSGKKNNRKYSDWLRKCYINEIGNCYGGDLGNIDIDKEINKLTKK